MRLLPVKHLGAHTLAEEESRTELFLGSSFTRFLPRHVDDAHDDDRWMTQLSRVSKWLRFSFPLFSTRNHLTIVVVKFLDLLLVGH